MIENFCFVCHLDFIQAVRVSIFQFNLFLNPVCKNVSLWFNKRNYQELGLIVLKILLYTILLPYY